VNIAKLSTHDLLSLNQNCVLDILLLFSSHRTSQLFVMFSRSVHKQAARDIGLTFLPSLFGVTKIPPFANILLTVCYSAGHYIRVG
jgi:hypothetical protein